MNKTVAGGVVAWMLDYVVNGEPEREYNGHDQFSGGRSGGTPLVLASDLEAYQQRIAEMDVAVSQAVEFAEYVEQAARGTMVERAEYFLSQPYSQRLKIRLEKYDEAAQRLTAAQAEADRLRVDAETVRADAFRECALIAGLHSQYPITTEFDRGYAKARRDASDAIHAAKTEQEKGE